MGLSKIVSIAQELEKASKEIEEMYPGMGIYESPGTSRRLFEVLDGIDGDSTPKTICYLTFEARRFAVTFHLNSDEPVLKVLKSAAVDFARILKIATF